MKKDILYSTYTGNVNAYTLKIDLIEDQQGSFKEDLEKKVKKVILELFNKYKELDKNDRLGSLRAIYYPEQKELQVFKNIPFAKFWILKEGSQELGSQKYIIDYFYRQISISEEEPFISRHLDIEVMLLDLEETTLLSYFRPK